MLRLLGERAEDDFFEIIRQLGDGILGSREFHEGERRLLAAKKEAGEISPASIIRDAIFFW